MSKNAQLQELRTAWRGTTLGLDDLVQGPLFGSAILRPYRAYSRTTAHSAERGCIDYIFVTLTLLHNNSRKTYRNITITTVVRAGGAAGERRNEHLKNYYTTSRSAAKCTGLRGSTPRFCTKAKCPIEHTGYFNLICNAPTVFKRGQRFLAVFCRSSFLGTTS